VKVQNLGVIGDREEAKRLGSMEENGVLTLMTAEVCIRTHRISASRKTTDKYLI